MLSRPLQNRSTTAASAEGVSLVLLRTEAQRFRASIISPYMSLPYILVEVLFQWCFTAWPCLFKYLMYTWSVLKYNKHLQKEDKSIDCSLAKMCQRASRWANVQSLFAWEAHRIVNTTYQQLNTHYSYHYHEVLFRYDGLDGHWSHCPAVSSEHVWAWPVTQSVKQQRHLADKLQEDMWSYMWDGVLKETSWKMSVCWVE